MVYEVDLTQVTYALSDALDLVGGGVVQHGKRVTLIALETARGLQLPSAETEPLALASLIHDCGVSTTTLHRKLLQNFDWEGDRDHCARGYSLLAPFAPLEDEARLVQEHHTRWDEHLERETPPRTAFLSNLIFLADRVDALIQQRVDRDLLIARRDIRTAVRRLSGDYFAPELVEAFLRVSLSESLWLLLEPHHLERFLGQLVGRLRPRRITFEELRHLAEIFATIVDAKSPFTADHSRGVSRLARLLGELLGLPEKDLGLLEVAGLLHDLGKLRVPDEILDKPAALTELEFASMERHTFETFQILSRLETLAPLAEWAAYHHESITGEGYPFRRAGDDVAVQARIMAVADVYQALAQDRPYRRALAPAQILRTLREMSESGKLDPALVELVARSPESCWQAAVGRGGPPA